MATFNNSDLVRMKLDPPRFNDGNDWELFDYTFISVVGVMNPKILTIIPGYEDHPFAKSVKTKPLDPPDSPINEPLLSPATKIKKEREEEEDEQEGGTTAELLTTKLKTVGISQATSSVPSVPKTIIPTEMKSQVPILTGGSRPTSKLYAIQFDSQYLEEVERQEKSRLNRVLYALLLQSCSHDRKVMRILRLGGTDGVACFLELKKHYGGLDVIKFQEDQQTIYHSYPRKVRDVKSWLANYLVLIEKQEKLMGAPIPMMMKSDMIMNKIKHLTPFTKYYENTWQSLLPNQRPSLSQFLQVVEQLAQGHVSQVKMHKMFGTGSSRSDPITVNLVSKGTTKDNRERRQRERNESAMRCWNCSSKDHGIAFCTMQCRMKDCPGDNHDAVNCPVRKLTRVSGRGVSKQAGKEAVEEQQPKADKVQKGRTKKKNKEGRKLKASDFIKKKKMISLNAESSDYSPSSSSGEEEEEEEEESDHSESGRLPRIYSKPHANPNSNSDSDDDDESGIGHIHHMAILMMRKEEGQERVGGGDVGITPPRPLFDPHLTPPTAAVLREVREGKRELIAPDRVIQTSRITPTTTTHLNTTENGIPPLHENNFQSVLDMAGDPTPLNQIIPLEEKWALRRTKTGYVKILVKGLNPVHIREIGGPPLNLYGRPVKPDGCHVPSSKQCEGTTERTGNRCIWKLSAARRGVSGGECAARLLEYDFCSHHIPQERKREEILCEYRIRLRKGMLPPYDAIQQSPISLFACVWRQHTPPSPPTPIHFLTPNTPSTQPNLVEVPHTTTTTSLTRLFTTETGSDGGDKIVPESSCNMSTATEEVGEGSCEGKDRYKVLTPLTSADSTEKQRFIEGVCYGLKETVRTVSVFRFTVLKPF